MGGVVFNEIINLFVCVFGWLIEEHLSLGGSPHDKQASELPVDARVQWHRTDTLHTRESYRQPTCYTSKAPNSL